MANIDINWNWDRTTGVNIDLSTSRVCFYMPQFYNGYTGFGKVCITIPDIKKYKSITLNYSSFGGSGIYDFCFGVFDNTSPTSTSGVVSSHTFPRGSGGTVTISGEEFDKLSGTKYVGFWFYGNATSPGVNEYGYPVADIYINSLTAVESGYTLTYNANGGSGAPSSVNAMSTTISSTIPTRTGYDFLGWSTSKTATSASYFAGNTISLSSDVTLYAVWRKKTYTVTYNANGGSGAPSNQTKTHDTTLILSATEPTKAVTSAGSYTVTLNANGGTCAYGSLSAERTTSYTFSKWNTNSYGTGTSYSPGASYTSNKALTLYAIYNSSTSTESVTLPTPERDGYEFMGWATSNMVDSGVTGDYTPTKNVTLYAIWKSMGIVYIYDGVEYSPYKVLIYDGSGWNQYMPYIYTESGWEVYSG